jgi:hypothetical protein
MNDRKYDALEHIVFVSMNQKAVCMELHLNQKYQQERLMPGT